MTYTQNILETGSAPMAESENRPDLSQLVEQRFSHQALELLFHPRRQPDLELDLFVFKDSCDSDPAAFTMAFKHAAV